LAGAIAAIVPLAALAMTSFRNDFRIRLEDKANASSALQVYLVFSECVYMRGRRHIGKNPQAHRYFR
jgi:hypothetical protein